MLCENRLKQYSRRERNLIYVVLFLLCVLLVFVIVLVARRGNNICLTPSCIQTASYILDSIDPSVDPCENFNEFACGGFLKKSEILEQPTHLHALNNIKKNQLKQIVTEQDDEENTVIPKSVHLQRKFYRACENTSAIEDDQDQTFLNLLDEIIGGWPLTKGNAWSEKDFDWVKVMERTRSLGMEHRFFFDVSVHVQNSTSKILQITPWTFSIIIEDDTKKFEDLVYKWGSRIIGITSQLRLVNTFSEQLHEIIEKVQNTTLLEDYKTTTISKLKNIRFIKIHWLQFLKNITGIQSLSEDDEILIGNIEEYFKDLYYLLMKTPKRVQANYIAVILIEEFSGYLSENVRKAFPKGGPHNQEKNSSRSHFCYNEAVTMFPSVAEGQYVRKYTTKDVKENIEIIIRFIKSELKYALQSNTFMDDETRKNSIKFLSNITENVGWTDTVRDAKKFEEVFGYDKLELSSTENVLTMAREMKKFQIDNNFRILKSVSYVTRALEYPDVNVNAYYLPIFNSLMLPAPILQPPIYSLNRPKYANFGALGSVIGHEFTHAFSDNRWKGLEEKNWTIWSNETIENYNKLSECVVEEYEKYPKLLDNFSDNGTTVLREVIADLNGVNIAYRAYQKWSDENGHEDNLPGLPYTPNQLFWISFGSLYCYQYKLRDLDEVVNIDRNHPVPSFRIEGSLRNSPHFAGDFSCPVGTEMNPEKKCRIFT